MSTQRPRCVEVPGSSTYALLNATAPVSCLVGAAPGLEPDSDGLVKVDLVVRNGRVATLCPAGALAPDELPLLHAVDMRGRMLLPTFADLHTHIDKGHTCERSRNPTGNLGGADRSTASDASFWDLEDVFRRMDFSVRCAYAHGTSALRTHLINMQDKQIELTWAAFDRLRAKWAGKVELQGVSLVVLSAFRDEAASEALADIVASHGGILGAAVCCSENGGLPDDDWTTCEADRGELLDRVFALAQARGLLIDFHVDENGNEAAKGLRHIAAKTIEHGYQGKVVCGHCCSLAFQPPEELAKTLALAKEAQITVVSLPLVNEWTQDRDEKGLRTPRWRGITALQELRTAGVPTALASDNTRDQFYAYGDLDMMEVFTQSVRAGHLDRPGIRAWAAAISGTPAAAMHLSAAEGDCTITVGGPANMVLFRGRKYSELLARPQFDRVVIRDGAPIDACVPEYEELDYDADSKLYELPGAASACAITRAISLGEIALAGKPAAMETEASCSWDDRIGVAVSSGHAGGDDAAHAEDGSDGSNASVCESNVADLIAPHAAGILS